MSIKVMTWVWDHSPAKGSERLVLLALADNAGDDDWRCWPSLTTIARKTQLSRRQVINVIQQLETDGLIEVQRTVNQSNSYTVIATSEKISLPSEKISPPITSEEFSPPSETQFTSASEIAIAPESSIEPSVNHHSVPSEPAPPPKSDHTVGMEMLHSYIGPYPDGGAQAKALKWMLENGATLQQIEGELKRQIIACAEGATFRPSFLTVQKTIFPPLPVSIPPVFASPVSPLEPLFPERPVIVDYNFMAPRSKEGYDQ